MTLRIGQTTRILQRGAGKAEQELADATRHLSSGLRIERASDDSAGLQISQTFTSQVRGYARAARNAYDGMGIARQTDIALSETVATLQKMQTLAVQAANDVNSDKERAMLQAGISQLIDELNRIGETNEFAGMHMLNGEFLDRAIHIGANRGDATHVTVQDARASHLGRYAVRVTSQVSEQALDKDQLRMNGISVRATVASDDSISTTLNRSSAIAKAAAINDASQYSGVSAFVNATRHKAAASVMGGTLDSSQYLSINGRSISGFFIRQDDADRTLADAINKELEFTGVRAEFNHNSEISLIAEDGRNIEIETTGNAHLITGLRAEAGHSVTRSTLNLFSDDLFTISDPNDDGSEVVIGAVEDDIVAANDSEVVQTIDVSTREGANRGLIILERALEQAMISRSEMGGLENRLEFTVSRLNTAAQMAHQARSRVLDADVASEATKLARGQIMQKAFTNILAQANNEPQRVMRLL